MAHGSMQTIRSVHRGAQVGQGLKMSQIREVHIQMGIIGLNLIARSEHGLGSGFGACHEAHGAFIGYRPHLHGKAILGVQIKKICIHDENLLGKLCNIFAVCKG